MSAALESAAAGKKAAAAAAEKPANLRIFRKTKMCKFNMMGRCNRTASCMFAHDAEELQPLPDFRCTKMCPDLSETGRCDKGAACTFAHSTKELRFGRVGSKRTSDQEVQAAKPAAPVTAAPTLPISAAAAAPWQASGDNMAVLPPPQPFQSWNIGGSDSPVSSLCSEDAPPPPDFEPQVDMQALRVALEVSCKEAAYPAWSRQSTMTGEDSPVSTEEDMSGWTSEGEGSWVSEQLSSASSASSEASPKSAWVREVQSWACEQAVDEERSQVEAPFVASRLGLRCNVVRTFLQFADEEESVWPLRRSLSTSCLGLSL